MYILINITHLLIKLCPTKFLLYFVQKTLITKGYRKQVINKNFKNTIGKGISTVQFEAIYRKCLSNISRILVETIKFTPSKSSNLSYHDISKLEKVCIDNNGLILMASHYGNWELACINLPLHTSIPCYGVYKPLKNKSLDKKLIQLRSKFGLNLVPMNSIARHIAKNNNEKSPAIYILIADQNPRSFTSVIWTDFLGIKTAFANGLVKLKKKYNLGIAYMKITPGQSLFQYKIEFEYPETKEENLLIQWYSLKLEHQINLAPEYWLWSHKRWKRKYKP